MKKPSVKYEDGLKKALADPEDAAAYLNAALEDGSQDVFLMALRDVPEARGSRALRGWTSLNRENMYRILSEKGKPSAFQPQRIARFAWSQLAVKVKNVPLDKRPPNHGNAPCRAQRANGDA